MSETTPNPTKNPLDNLHIASPCHASWDAMTGDDQARFCKTCNKNVFNLTMMTRQDAENLIRAKEGNLCVRFSQREDGTILTQDCPVGFERARQQALRPFRFVAAGIAAIIAALGSIFGIAPRVVAQPPINTTAHAREIQGDVAMPAPSAIKTMGRPRATTPTSELPKMGQPIVCAKPAQTKPSTQPPALMGKPSTAMLQGEIAPVAHATPKPTATPVPLMGMIAPPTHKMGKPVAHPAKPVTKAKKVSQTKRAKH